MISDIRLDLISDIDISYIEKIKEIRKGFIAIDDLLKGIANEAKENKKLAALRTVDLARTFNEQSLQFTSKSLCILGEIK